ncbi:MAG: (d)CMP kinase [Deltaproteobacteria bacterium]|nr:(d)CMP kinase [Deltaproteobacteria bacterium]
MRFIQITIDGPAGAGKSTVAKELAKRLRYQYIDTGAMYRAFALAVLRAKLDLQDSKALGALCKTIEISESWEDGMVKTFLYGEDVSQEIRKNEVGAVASQIATCPEVRERLVGQQREMGRETHVVVEGRDTGTVVFPEAKVKFFLDASAEIRVQRRALEWSGGSKEIGSAEVFTEIQERDARDRGRSLSPLTLAKDAVYIDSTGKTVAMVVDEMLECIRQKLKVGRSPV